MIHIAIISHARPLNVVKMQRHLDGLPCTWYVASEDIDLYTRAGAQMVIASGGLINSRNRALDDAGDNLCLQLSDDLQAVKQATRTSQSKPMTLAAAMGLMVNALQASPFYLCGTAPTDNDFYYSPARRIGSGFIVGDMILVKPCPLRFDGQLRLKEDYDYTLQHMRYYGGVLRMNEILCSFQHRDNAGGAVEYRNSDLERDSIRYLRRKWGNLIKDNPKRPDEILLNLK
jgi:hypothetical protein